VEQDNSKISRYLRAKPSSIQRQGHPYMVQIKRIQKMLRKGEKVLAVALQPRMLPGGSYLVPNIIYATNERIIVSGPHLTELNGVKVSIPYCSIVNIKLEQGIYSTLAVKFELSASSNAAGMGMIHGIVGGKIRNERILDAIPRAKAEDLMKAILISFRRNKIKFRAQHLTKIRVGHVM
jgi:Bacterial PH domain